MNKKKLTRYTIYVNEAQRKSIESRSKDYQLTPSLFVKYATLDKVAQKHIHQD